MVNRSHKTQAGRAKRDLAIAVALVVALAAGLALAAVMHAALQRSTATSPGTYSVIAARFSSELNRSAGINDLGAVYYYGNISATINGSASSAVHVLQTERIGRYVLGNMSKIVIYSSLSYFDQSSNILRSYSNITSYYSAPAGSMTCLNESGHGGPGQNASVSCFAGAAPIQPGGLQSAVANASAMLTLAREYNGTYLGTKTIAGRVCDYYSFSNNSASGSYTEYSICLDRQYGIPLYLNATVVLNGTEIHSTALTASGVYTNLTSSDVTLPSQYALNTTSMSV